MVKQQCADLKYRDFRFSRWDIRESTGGVTINSKCIIAFARTVLLVHRGGRGQLFEYELLYNVSSAFNQPLLPGLVDVSHLKKTPYDDTSLGQNVHKLG